jgi:predicted AAA+ superfamily ATPase
LWDYTYIEDIWARNENLIANHLLKWVHFLQDVYWYNVNLQYLRDKEKREVDFVITENQNVKYLIEVKTDNTSLSKHLLYYKNKFPQAKCFQIVFWNKEIDIEKSWIRIISASKFLSWFV